MTWAHFYGVAQHNLCGLPSHRAPAPFPAPIGLAFPRWKAPAIATNGREIFMESWCGCCCCFSSFSCLMKISRQSKRIINCAAATAAPSLAAPATKITKRKTKTKTTTTNRTQISKVGIMHRCAEAEHSPTQAHSRGNAHCKKRFLICCFLIAKGKFFNFTELKC